MGAVKFVDPRDKGMNRLLQRFREDFYAMRQEDAVADSSYLGDMLRNDRKIAEISLHDGLSAVRTRLDGRSATAVGVTLRDGTMCIGRLQNPVDGDAYYVGRADDGSVRINEVKRSRGYGSGADVTQYHVSKGAREGASNVDCRPLSLVDLYLSPAYERDYRILNTGEEERELELHWRGAATETRGI